VYYPVRTFYTATDGNDANPGTRERPFRTIGRAVPTLQAGDVLYVRQGEYREYLSSGSKPLAGGSGWDRPIVVSAMPGETVVIRPPDSEGRDPLINLMSPQQQYLVFDNLVLDADNVTLPFKSQSRDGKDAPPAHIRVVNCELMHAKGSGARFVGQDHQFMHCRIHSNGHSSDDHGLLISGEHNLIQGCDIYHNAGSGIQLYNPSENAASNNVIRGNRIHNNGLSPPGNGIGLHTGRENLVYDNVIWGNSFGIVVADQGSAEQILNNTIHGNRGPGIAISPETETHHNVVRINILVGNRDPNLLNE